MLPLQNAGNSTYFIGLSELTCENSQNSTWLTLGVMSYFYYGEKNPYLFKVELEMNVKINLNNEKTVTF